MFLFLNFYSLFIIQYLMDKDYYNSIYSIEYGSFFSCNKDMYFHYYTMPKQEKLSFLANTCRSIFTANSC